VTLIHASYENQTRALRADICALRPATTGARALAPSRSKGVSTASATGLIASERVYLDREEALEAPGLRE